MRNFAIGIFLSASLAGCATGVDPNDLRPVSGNESFTLVEYIEHKSSSALQEVVEGLKPGKYKAEFEDEDGTYYRGPGRCVKVSASTGYKAEAEGGLWFPKKKGGLMPRVYAYIHADNNPTVDKAGPTINALIERDYGRISFGTNITDSKFIDKIKIDR